MWSEISTVIECISLKISKDTNMSEFAEVRKRIAESIEKRVQREEREEQERYASEEKRLEREYNLRKNQGKIREVVENELKAIIRGLLDGNGIIIGWGKRLSETEEIRTGIYTDYPIGDGTGTTKWTGSYNHQVEFDCIQLRIPDVGDVNVFIKTKDGRDREIPNRKWTWKDKVREVFFPNMLEFEKVQPQQVIITTNNLIPDDEHTKYILGGLRSKNHIDLDDSIENVGAGLRTSIINEVEYLYKRKYE